MDVITLSWLSVRAIIFCSQELTEGFLDDDCCCDFIVWCPTPNNFGVELDQLKEEEGPRGEIEKNMKNRRKSEWKYRKRKCTGILGRKLQKKRNQSKRRGSKGTNFQERKAFE